MHIALWLLTLLSFGLIGSASEERVVWVGRTQVLPFRLDASTGEDRELEWEAEDADLLELVRPPRVAAGRHVGFARLRGLAPGTTELRIGDRRFTVRVRPVPVTTETLQVRSSVTSPVDGAFVFGRLSVGVEVQAGASRAAVSGGEVFLRLSGGEELAGQVVLANRGDAEPRRVFELDTDLLAPGPLALTPTVRLADGSVVDGVTTNVTVVRAPQSHLFVAECEADIEGAEIPQLGSHPDASGGGFVHLTRREVPWSMPLEITEAGLHQLVIVARGTYAAGAFPSLGLLLGGSTSHAVGGRVIDAQWRRTPLGAPVHLTAGEHRLGLGFLNPNYLGSLERLPQIDRVELLRIPDEPQAIEASGSMMGAMSMVAMITGGMERLENGAFGSGRLSVSFDRAFDGEPLNGRFVVRGSCNYEDDGAGTAPRVELLVNGRVRASQVAARPLFALDPCDLAVGENGIQLQASLSDGTLARSPVQTVHQADHGAPQAGRRRSLHRFSVLDPAWGAFQRRDDEGDDRGHASAAFQANEAVTLELPETLEGDFDLLLEARGPDGTARGRLGFTLVDGGGETPLEAADIQGWWNDRQGPSLTLAPGPKRLVVTRLDPVPEGTEKRLRLRSVLLRTVDARPDRVAPRADIVYPTGTHGVHGSDAVIVEAWDDDRLAGAELFLDGRPSGIAGHVPAGSGYLVLPFSTRGLDPGEHTLAVRVSDLAGNVGDSRTVPLVVLSEPPAQPGAYARAQRLLSRFAYGPGPRELAAILLRGERAWLEDELGAFDAGDQAALGAAEARMRDINNYWVGRAALEHALRTPHPARTRLVFWLENHFSTWMRKTQGPSEWREHLRFLRLGAAPFQELLFASATSPAMLTYLDQNRSYAGRLNENYAREILELHTLGVDGGYTQEEVTTLARVLAGLTLAEEALPTGQGALMMRTLRFDPDLSDGGAHDVLGLALEAAAPGERRDRLDLVLEMLASHPSTAEHVAHELARHYVSDPPPAELVADLAAVFTTSGGELREVLLALAEHPAFLDADLEPRVTTPFDYAVRVARTADVPELSGAAQGYLDRAGMGIFDRATPDGWPEEDEAWTDSNGLLQRWRFVQEVPWALRRLVPDTMRRSPAGDPEVWLQRAIDHAALRLTGSTLGEESNAAALAYFEETEGQLWQRLDTTLSLVARLPEANLRP